MKQRTSKSTSPCPETRLRRRALSPALGVLLCAAAGCLSEPSDPQEPSAPRQVRTAFEFQVGSRMPPYGMYVVLDEDPTLPGEFAGTLTFIGMISAQNAATTATMDENGTLHIPAGEVSEFNTSFRWHGIDLRLSDPDGDSVLESGTGHITGNVFLPTDFEADFTARPNALEARALASRQGSASIEMLPWEPIAITLGQPVTSDQIDRYRVLASGHEVPGTTETLVEGDMHTRIRFVPESFYPLGTTLEVEIAGMKNAIGIPVEIDNFPMEVQADPGSFAANLGFERDLAGWHAVGDAVVMTSAGDVLPAEGAAMAALRISPESSNGIREAGLIGYLDVPADATTLDLSLALLAPEDSLPAAAVIRVHRALDGGGVEVREVYAFDPASALLEPCACGTLDGEALSRRSGPFRHAVDVSALRGERVFLEIQIEGGVAGVRPLATPMVPPPPPAPAILLVDDLQLR